MSATHDAHAWFIEHRISFATQTLDTADSRTFAAHLAGCSDCAAAVRSMEQDLQWLPLGVTPAAVRPGLRGEITRAVLERDSTRSPQVPRRALALAAGLLLMVSAAMVGVSLGRRDSAHLARSLDAKSLEIGMLRDTISVMRQASRVLSASIATDGRDAGLLIFADDVSHRWNVVMHGLPQAPDGMMYQFWFVTADGMVRSVSLNANASGPAFATLEMPPGGSQVVGASLTLEPAHQRATVPMGKQLAEIML